MYYLNTSSKNYSFLSKNNQLYDNVLTAILITRHRKLEDRVLLDYFQSFNFGQVPAKYQLEKTRTSRVMIHY